MAKVNFAILMILLKETDYSDINYIITINFKMW